MALGRSGVKTGVDSSHDHHRNRTRHKTNTALLHLYGPEDAQLLLAAQIGRLEAERARLLAALPAWRRELVRAREAEAAAADGEGADRWAFPAPILDERAFREREREWERRQKHGDGGGGGL